jgi:hypothetical protein
MRIRLKRIDLKGLYPDVSISLAVMITEIDAPKNCTTESDDIAHINALIDSLSDDDIKQLIGDGINKRPTKPFKPIR